MITSDFPNINYPSKGDGKSDLAHRLTGDALQKHRDKRSAEYEADLVKKRAANAARLKSYDESFFLICSSSAAWFKKVLLCIYFDFKPLVFPWYPHI